MKRANLMRVNPLIIICMAVVMICSCQKDSKLKRAVEEMNEECPIDMGTVGEMTSFEYKDGNVIMSYNVNEDIVNIDALQANPDLMRQTALTMFTNSEKGGTKNLLADMEEAGAGLTLQYTGIESGKTVSVTLTSEELAEAKETANDDTDPDAVLEKEVEVTNAQMPMEAGSGITITSLVIEGDYVIYNCSVDESIVTVEDIQAGAEEAKASMKQALTTDDPANTLFIQMCKNAGKGIGYRYIGNQTSDECTITIDASEL